MDIHYYNTSSAAAAFALASRDSKTWSFPEMDALAEMAQLLQDGYEPQPDGMAKSCFCHRGWFKLFGPDAKGYGIALVQLRGYESGIDDPAAQEVLDHHRERRGHAVYARELLDFSEHISDIDQLDAAYGKLVEAGLIDKTGGTVTVVDRRGQHQRPTYRVR